MHKSTPRASKNNGLKSRKPGHKGSKHSKSKVKKSKEEIPLQEVKGQHPEISDQVQPQERPIFERLQQPVANQLQQIQPTLEQLPLQEDQVPLRAPEPLQHPNNLAKSPSPSVAKASKKLLSTPLEQSAPKSPNKRTNFKQPAKAGFLKNSQQGSNVMEYLRKKQEEARDEQQHAQSSASAVSPSSPLGAKRVLSPVATTARLAWEKRKRFIDSQQQNSNNTVN